MRHVPRHGPPIRPQFKIGFGIHDVFSTSQLVNHVLRLEPQHVVLRAHHVDARRQVGPSRIAGAEPRVAPVLAHAHVRPVEAGGGAGEAVGRGGGVGTAGEFFFNGDAPVDDGVEG